MRELFDVIAARSPDALAGWRGAAPVVHGAWLARVRAWAALGRRSSATQVALFHDDTLEFAAALLGAWLSGKTVWLVADTLAGNCAALAGRVDAFWGAFPAAQAPLAPGAHDDWHGAWIRPARDFAALVVFTSGSTGAPTPIAKRFDQLTSEVAALERQFGAGIEGADVLSTVSHQHIYGLLFRVLWPLAQGRAIHAERHEFPETLAPALAARPCVLLASPAHLKRLPPHLDWSGAGAMLRAVFSSGGMLEPDAAVQTAVLLGRAPFEVYGSSESGGVAWRQRGADSSAAWTPLPGVEWRIGAAGTLDVRSAFAGAHGWLALADRAGDAGAGRFALFGRGDRIVKIEEKRVSLDALESALVACGLAREARMLVLEGPRQSLAAFVLPSEGGRALLQAEGRRGLNARLRAVLAQVVEALALPRRWRYLDAWPVNAQGKTTQAQLLALLELPARPDGAAAGRPRWPGLRVLEQAPGRALLELIVPADLLYFDGHFHVAPVLPGVVQVDWAIAYGRQYLGLDGAFAGINALKFQQMIRPGHPVRLELLHDAVKGSLNFRYFSDAGAHASGRILLGSVIAC